MKTKKLSKFLAGSALVLSLLGSPKISAQEIKPVNIEEILYGPSSDTTSQKIGLIFNYNKTGTNEIVEYSKSNNYFSGGSLIRKDNLPELTDKENSDIENLIIGVGDKKINSYSEFINLSKNFSEKQKIVLASSISQLLYAGSYNQETSQNEIKSQEIFFNHLQNFLETYDQNPLGQCGQISTYTERLLTDLRIKSSSVSGIRELGHAFNILKLQDGTGIIDGGQIFISKTKNVEKLLENYQKNVNFVAFQHLFFEDNKFKYQLITRDGKNFLNFIGYDPSSIPIKNLLIMNESSDFEAILQMDHGDSITSFGINYFGLITKAGEIRGNSSSSLDSMFLTQSGFKRKFSFQNFDITPNLNLILKDGILSGGFVDLVVNTANKKGINLSSRISGNILVDHLLTNQLFFDYSFGAGVSDTLPINYGEIIPYSDIQFKFIQKDLGMQEFFTTFQESESGIKLNFSIPKDLEISLNPYYTKRLWEDEFGANAQLGSKNIKLEVNGYLTKSDYMFCPDKFGFDFGVDTSINKYFNLNAKYKTEQTNYGGEIENNSSFSLTGKIIID